MQLRNLFFDLGILPSQKFNKPVISIGNLTYGGTGKTPHVEYLIRLLSPQLSLATLSRGYGRNTRGFLVATEKSVVGDIGDEPLQYLKKFPLIRVAVDERRPRGVQMLFSQFPGLNAVLLDDAFQHRYIKPGLSILLTDYHRLYPDDFVLPSGTLREFRSGAKRADIIIVTKTPKIFSPITRRRILEDLKPGKHQQVYFSYIRYDDPVAVFHPGKLAFPVKASNILLFTGIANDYPLRDHLGRMCRELIAVKYPDHHQYTITDLEVLVKKFNDLPTQKKILVTTEKDVMRLKIPGFCTILENLPLFYIPMEVDFHGEGKEMFDKEILSYVGKY